MISREGEGGHLDEIKVRFSELALRLGAVGGVKRDIVLSIVIPAFNEMGRLPKTLIQTIEWCRQHVISYEVVVSDDGSSDDTLAIAQLAHEYDERVKVLECPHLGKGAAVRMGMLNAQGKFLLFMDADGATPLLEISKLLAKMEEGYSIAVGSRALRTSGETVVKTPLHRKLIGRIFAAMVSLFAVGGFADTQCGFKMFKRDVAQDVFRRQKLHGFAFDVEILFLAKKLSYDIAEVPVNWFNQEGSKVDIMTDSIKMLRDILRIRLIHRNLS